MIDPEKMAMAMQLVKLRDNLLSPPVAYENLVRAYQAVMKAWEEENEDAFKLAFAAVKKAEEAIRT